MKSEEYLNIIIKTILIKESTKIITFFVKKLNLGFDKGN
jgi:hypothetical protein